jgi:hypothetical protein
MELSLIRFAAWLSLLTILIVTAGPLSLRPTSGASADTERFIAFAVSGGLFGLGYPRQLTLVLPLIVLAAATFELAQLLFPGRHGTIHDFAVKAVGGLVGAVFGNLFGRFINFPGV